MMRTSYDPEADALSVWFGPEAAPAAETREVAPGVMVDFDASGQAVGVEVLGVRQRVGGTYGAAAPSAAAE